MISHGEAGKEETEAQVSQKFTLGPAASDGEAGASHLGHRLR
jgi:hypothetical protein